MADTNMINKMKSRLADRYRELKELDALQRAIEAEISALECEIESRLVFEMDDEEVTS
jgi:hypothetical protein